MREALTRTQKKKIKKIKHYHPAEKYIFVFKRLFCRKSFCQNN